VDVRILFHLKVTTGLLTATDKNNNWEKPYYRTSSIFVKLNKKYKHFYLYFTKPHVVIYLY